MKTGILSDVHGNVEALTAVLEDMQQRGVDDVVCLGDCVGYGAEPDRCLDILTEACSNIVAGNHDLAAAGKLDESRFNSLARSSVHFTRSKLRKPQLEYLAELPMTAAHDDMLLVHASPSEPMAFPYIKDCHGARTVFEAGEFKLAVFGHTHQPMAFQCDSSRNVTVSLNPTISLQLDHCSYFINVGSVGQPRDCDPRSCYSIFDSEQQQLRLHRVEYDARQCADKILAEGLPSALGERLLAGV